MKFKVTRNEPLEKAMNKANLVLVEVPVNTKKGQHRSHRWKRAIDALDQLFEDLGKKANSEDIAFIDKNTNKKVNKDELIKDYKNRGKKENKTLQTFVAENYKVSTKENGKEEELTVNNKNTDNNKANTTEDIKETEAPKEKIVTMASRSKYKQEHFYGTFKCGHEGDLYTGGYSEEYRKQAAEDKFDHELCPHCEQKRIEEEREKEREEARKVAGEIGLPQLEGSEKQIDWALSIRNKVVEDLKPSIDYAEKILENEPSNKIAKAYVKMGKDFLNITDSAKWIDYRKLDFKNVMVNIISGYDWRDIPWYGTFISDNRRLDKDFLFDYNSLPRFESVEAERNKNYLCHFINTGIWKYLKLTLKEENPQSSEMAKWINEYQSIAENTNDELFYESLESDDFYILSESKEYRPKLSGNEDHDSMLKAYKKRNELIKDLVIRSDKNSLSENQLVAVKNTFETETNASFYLDAMDLSFDEFVEVCEGGGRKIKEKIDKVFKNVKDNPFIPAKKPDGTDKIESKGEYKKSESFQDLKKSLSKLKGMNAKVVGRAVMDMAGIDAPLYVSRNGKPFIHGRTPVSGYCSHSLILGDVYEIGLVDFPKDRANSYKTAIHETMHGLLSKTMNGDKSFTYNLPSRYNEGMVEIVASAGLKEAYGKEYKSKDRRGYEDYVVDTALKLKRMPEYKDKTISQLGQILGDAAFNGDIKTLEKIKKHLVNTRISYNQVKSFTPEQIEKAAKNRYAAEHDGDMTNFEKTQLAMLVERIKNTNYTLEDAMKGGQRYLAFVLLYNILDEEDDETLGLL